MITKCRWSTKRLRARYLRRRLPLSVIPLIGVIPGMTSDSALAELANRKPPGDSVRGNWDLAPI
jgi:hypothetical protein